MAWKIHVEEGVAVVEMNSNDVNRQNPGFFDDLDSAMDRLAREFAELPVVLTSSKHVFSAGFDFDYWFPLIAKGDVETVDATYSRIKKINLRLFSYPKPTVAAINGHAYAGGLITAFCCDVRVAADTGVNVALNEVPIGLAMPALFTEIIRYAIGTQLAAKATLIGKTYTGKEAHELGMVDALAPEADLLAKAVTAAKSLASDCLPAYAFSKRALQAPVLKFISEETEQLDGGFGQAWCSEGAKSATDRKYRELKGRPSRARSPGLQS